MLTTADTQIVLIMLQHLALAKGPHLSHKHTSDIVYIPFMAASAAQAEATPTQPAATSIS